MVAGARFGTSAAVPVPVRSGRPDGSFPWPWSITPWLPGGRLAELSPADRAPYAAVLGHFYACLHAPAPGGAPINPFRGRPLADRSSLLQRHLGQVDTSRIDVTERQKIRDLWTRLSATPGWRWPPVWLHGDPHPGNVLVDGERVTAVIDFGDLTSGDPATDLALGWRAFDPHGRRLFREAYGQERPLEAATWDRARGSSLCLAVALLANTDDEPVLADVGRHGLAEVLAGR